MEPRVWIGPSILSVILAAQLIYTLGTNDTGHLNLLLISPRGVGIALFGPYLLCVELASILLLAALVGAYRIAHSEPGGR
jgi:NADH-quinone oxidoreductase subunit J